MSNTPSASPAGESGAPQPHPRLRKLYDRLQGWSLPAFGALALVWFIVRVVPKPSRAMYPCMRASFPMATGFVIWLLSMFGMRLAWRHLTGALQSRRMAIAAFAGICGVVASATWVVTMPSTNAIAAVDNSHGPIGEGKGVFPGRVVWVHAPDATDWAGKQTNLRWSDPERTHGPTVDRMMDDAIISLGGGNSVGEAWDNMFHYFNSQRGNGERGYIPGEKIMIKLNLTTANNNLGSVDSNYNKIKGVHGDLWNNIDVAPQTTIALLRHLVYEVGVAESDIYIGDTVCLIANYIWELVHPIFPDVNFVDIRGTHGRYKAEFSDVRMYWSQPEAEGSRPDYLPESFAEAAYVINVAIPKSHGSGGITACAKNHYGSFIRTPDSRLYGVTDESYFDLHESLPSGDPGMGKYRSFVDIMGHPELGAKTILYLLDGLYSGHNWRGEPERWKMAPFNNDWPSSIFASMDPVAIDSVAYDFVSTEWPEEVLKASLGEGGAQDYLHEAAQADDPPSGTFYDPAGDGSGLHSLGVHEHWNNPIDKQYSRNFGYDYGIELVHLEIDQAQPAPEPKVRVVIDADAAIVSTIHLAPNLEYVLETINPDTGATTTLQTLPTGTYGQRAEFPLTDTPAFYRIRQK